MARREIRTPSALLRPPLALPPPRPPPALSPSAAEDEEADDGGFSGVPESFVPRLHRLRDGGVCCQRLDDGPNGCRDCKDCRDWPLSKEEEEAPAPATRSLYWSTGGAAEVTWEEVNWRIKGSCWARRESWEEDKDFVFSA